MSEPRLVRHVAWLFAAAVAALAVLLPLVVHLGPGDQVMAHDAQLPASASRVAEQLEVLKPVNGGAIQGVSPPIGFTTAILYAGLFALGMKVGTAQAIGMTLTFGMALWLAIVGFDHLLRDWGRAGGARRRLDACLLGAVYIISPFTLISVSYGVFWSLNIALAIGCLPLLFHFYLQAFFEQRDRWDVRSLLGLCACLILVAWAILYLYPLFLVLVALQLLRGRIRALDVKKALFVSAVTLAGSLPTLYGLYVSAIDAGWPAATDPVSANAAFESIQGGVLTGLMQQAAWPLYTPWSPRLVLGFASHFFSVPYYVLTTALLLVVFATPILDGRPRPRRAFVYVAAMLLLVVFLVKGAGEPFGDAFRAFLVSVPGAGLVRTPDTKFGVFVTLAIATGLSIALAADRTPRWFRVATRALACAVVVYHAIPMMNGQAILARNSEFLGAAASRGYVVAPTPAEREIVARLQREPRAGVAILPPGYGVAARREGGLFMYRHVIADMITNPLLFGHWDEAPTDLVKRRLRAAVDGGEWTLLPELGVGFVLANRDTVHGHPRQYGLYRAIVERPDAWKRILDLGGYELYRLQDRYRAPVAAISSPSGPVALQVDGGVPWLVHIEAESLAPGTHTVTLQSPQNRHWRLLALPRGCPGPTLACTVRALISSGPYDIRRHPGASELVNAWQLETTPGPTGRKSLVALFLPQLWMYFFFAIGMVTLLACLAARLRLPRVAPVVAQVARE
jgi:hypothetical protein